MPIDDENNPQHEGVLARERQRIEHDVWVVLRIEAVLAEAASIAMLPDAGFTVEDFTGSAKTAFTVAQQRQQESVNREVARREWALATASPTTPTNEENKP